MTVGLVLQAEDADGVPANIPLTAFIGAAAETVYRQLTGIGPSTAVALSSVTDGIPDGAKYALVIASGAVRYRGDGTSPTRSVGMPVAAGQAFPVDGDLEQVKFISQEESGVTIDVEFKL